MKLKLTIDGKPYEVEVEIEEEAPRVYAPAAVMSSAAIPAAPMPISGAGPRRFDGVGRR